MLYMGPEPINMLTDEAMHMLEPKFPAVEFVSNAIQCIGDHTLLANVVTVTTTVRLT